MMRILSVLLLPVLLFSGMIKLYCQSELTNDHSNQIIEDLDGIHVAKYNFNINQLYEKNQWTGDWIWLNDKHFIDFQGTQTEWGSNTNDKRQYKALFRKSFELVEIPAQVKLSITADVSFRVFINGIFVAHGPSNIGNDYFDGVPPKHWFFSIYDVKSYLKPGNNTIAVEVYSYHREISETSSGHGLLICDLDDGNHQNIMASNDRWKCNIDTSFYKLPNSYYCYGNNIISNWNSESFDDSEWEYASIIHFKKYQYLIRSNIPVPFRYPVEPDRVWLGASKDPYSSVKEAVDHKQLFQDEFILDYGKNITAYYGFRVNAHRSDTVKVFPYEKDFGSTNRSLVYVCSEGENEFSAPYLSVFRYLKFEIISKQGVHVEDIDVHFSTYPVSYSGSFSCSDSNLTQLWSIIRWTTQLCMNDMFYDSPKHQEPIACTGDYFIESLINYYAFGDVWLTRQTLIKTALMLEKNNYDMFHTSYSLLWVQMVYQYYQYSGDKQLIVELIPYINKLNLLFETYLSREYLITNAPDFMFMDWVKIDKFNAHHPPAVIGMGYMTAFFYKSLLEAAELNKVVGNSSVEKHNTKLAKKIKTAFNNQLWDNKANLYKDGIPFIAQSNNHWFYPKDTAIVTYSPHVNTLAVLYDIAPKNQQKGIMKYVLNQDNIDLQPYFMFYVMAAVEHVGLFDTLGLEILKKWDDGICEETGTLKENWQEVTETGYNGDYSHAWGGCPLLLMSRNILGVKHSFFGSKTVEITPFLNTDISWAEGSIPLSSGECIHVGWRIVEKGHYQYTLEFPDDYSVYLLIPEPIAADGIIVNHKTIAKSTKRIKLSAGNNDVYFLAN